MGRKLIVNICKRRANKFVCCACCLFFLFHSRFFFWFFWFLSLLIYQFAGYVCRGYVSVCRAPAIGNTRALRLLILHKIWSKRLVRAARDMQSRRRRTRATISDTTRVWPMECCCLICDCSLIWSRRALYIYVYSHMVAKWAVAFSNVCAVFL